MPPATSPPASHSVPRAGASFRAATLGWGLLVIGLLAAPLVAQVQVAMLSATDLKRMSVEELLQQEVVSASRRPEALSQAASNIFLIRSQTAPSTGATVLPELLRLATNLFVAQKSSSEWGVNARGFMRTGSASNKLLVMIDGRTVYSPLFSNVFWESTSTFLPDLERIEVISGPAGSTWGSNAVNGVISIQSKSARETLGGLVTTSLGTEASSFGVRYGAELGQTGAARVYVQGAQHDSTLPATGTEDDYDSWTSLQYGLRADWGTAATGEFTLQGDAFNGRYRHNPQISIDTFNVLGRWARDLSPDSHLWIRAYHDYAHTEYENSNREVSHTTDLEFQHRLKLTPNQELLWGANYRQQEDSISNTVGFTIQPADLDFELGSIFGQHELRFAQDALKLTTGLRFEHNYYSGWEYLPNLRLAWSRPGQLAWVAASRSARIPSRLDVDFFAPETPPYFLIMGGPEFKAEIVHAYEAGWRVLPTKSLSLTTTVYYHDYDDLRSTEPSGPAILPVTIENLVNGSSQGVEFFADWDVKTWWRLRVGGFVMQQETWLKPGGADLEQGNGEASFPDYQAHVCNTFRLGKSVTWWTSLRHVAEVPAYDGGNGVVPAYTELDMCLTWKARPGLELSITGRNLLDASHPEIGGQTTRREIERSFAAALRWDF
jgi:iron complex outermembrane receptor protein